MQSSSDQNGDEDFILRPTTDLNKGKILKEINEDFQAFSMSTFPLEMEKIKSVNSEEELPKMEGNGNQLNANRRAIETTENKKIPHNNLCEKINENETPNTEKSARFVAPKDFELLKVIGIGAFGKVLQVRNKLSQKTFAMKVISKRLLRKKDSYVQNVQAERDILTKIRHPFIVSMHCSFQTKQKLFIIMDFCAGGELFLRLGREGVFLERTAAFYIAEITLALEHLHGRGILHRDLKPENILLNLDGHLALTDFGLAKDFSADSFDQNLTLLEASRVKTICGTGEYMAPEMIARKGYGKAADFWSLGCIAYEMMSGRPPFESNKGTKDLFRKILNERVRMPDLISASACRLLKGLLNRDAGKRLGSSKGTMFVVGGVTELKQVDFFAGLDWRLLELKEIDPPESLISEKSVNLEHFHDDFLKMELPRSVREMSKSDFKAQRCASTTFKGFSFIQEDFILPERPENELEHYWNNVDGDEYSLSTCASSKFHDEDVPPVPLKKKRPPRKKKKNKNKERTPENNQTENSNELAPAKCASDVSLRPTKDASPSPKQHHSFEVSPSVATNEKITDERELQSSSLAKKNENSNDMGPEEPKQMSNEAIWKKTGKKTSPATKATDSHKSHYSLSNYSYETKNKKEANKEKPPMNNTIVTKKSVPKPMPGSWAARAATSKNTTMSMTSRNRSLNSTNHEKSSLPQSALPKNMAIRNTIGSNGNPSQSYSSENRPAIAIQEAFWPSLGADGTNASKKSGAQPLKTTKYSSVNSSWPYKLSTQSNAWKS